MEQLGAGGESGCGPVVADVAVQRGQALYTIDPGSHPSFPVDELAGNVRRFGDCTCQLPGSRDREPGALTEVRRLGVCSVADQRDASGRPPGADDFLMAVANPRIVADAV